MPEVTQRVGRLVEARAGRADSLSLPPSSSWPQTPAGWSKPRNPERGAARYLPPDWALRASSPPAGCWRLCPTCSPCGPGAARPLSAMGGACGLPVERRAGAQGPLPDARANSSAPAPAPPPRPAPPRPDLRSLGLQSSLGSFSHSSPPPSCFFSTP